MGRLVREAYAVLDRRIEEEGGGAEGADDFLFKLCDFAAQGESLEFIAQKFGMRVGVLKRWLEDDNTRGDELALARRCFADKLVWEGLREARDAGIETVGLGKYRTESFWKMAGKLSRSEWGDQEVRGSGGMGAITIVIGSVEVPALSGATGNIVEHIQGVSSHESHEEADDSCVAVVGKPVGVGELSVG